MAESFSHHHFKDQRPDVKFFETFQWSCQDGKWHLKWQAHIIMASNCTRAVLCSVVYWPLYKSTESAWQGRVVGKSQNLAGQYFFIRTNKFCRISKGVAHESPRHAPISDGPSMAGRWGVSPVSVRSYGKYAAAGDISEQPSFLSDDVSIYNLQNACLCCYWIFFSMSARFFFGVRNRKPSNHRLRDCKIQGSAIGCNKSGFDRFLGIVGGTDFRGVNKNCPPREFGRWSQRCPYSCWL